MNDELDKIWKEAVDALTKCCQAFSWRDWKTVENRITCVPAEIRTENLPNVNLEHCWYTNLFGIPDHKPDIFTTGLHSKLRLKCRISVSSLLSISDREVPPFMTRMFLLVHVSGNTEWNRTTKIEIRCSIILISIIYTVWTKRGEELALATLKELQLATLHVLFSVCLFSGVLVSVHYWSC
jgi:hypothetical protein